MPKLAWVVIFLSGLCRADVLPPDVYELEKRADKDPAAYDRTDQFCRGKSPGSQCDIPGNPFEGGGNGSCRRWVNRADRTLDLVCVLSDPISIYRDLPQGGYRVGARLCEEARQDPALASILRSEGADCGSPAPASDRFCSGKTVGAACQVEARQGGSIGRYPGVCVKQSEESRFYRYGYNTMIRDVVLCTPEHPVVRQIEAPSPAGVLKRLFD